MLKLIYEDELQRALTEDGQRTSYLYHQKHFMEMVYNDNFCYR
jgi:hypothetical protein